MEPLTIVAIVVGTHIVRKFQGSASRATCQLCHKEISGTPFVTPCCDSMLSQKCVSAWQRTGGTHCMFCHASKS
jgi:hypothetical protein